MDGKVLVAIAKDAIEAKLNNKELEFAKYDGFTFLQEPLATFVTLTIDGDLRGCIGSLIATRPLIEDLIHNAKAAAFSDPRFAPLTAKEFKNVAIEISVLTPPQELAYSDAQDLKQKITPNTHGVIIKKGFKQATFLPSVWEQLPNFETFFDHLCQKASLSQNCLESHPQIFTYEAIKYS